MAKKKPPIKTIFPWQTAIWHRLWRCHAEQRLPHALWFVGMSGVGKKIFAEVFAQAVLCKQPNVAGLPCGDCHSCCLFQAQSHPDVVSIEPEKAGQAIKIDQIREMIDFASKTALQGGYRIMLIYSAANMNTYAANALLKTLEEPGTNTIIILVSDRNKELPATLRSRCQRVLFPTPSQEIALAWLRGQGKNEAQEWSQLLKIANGAPMRAIQFLDADVLTLRSDLFKGLADMLQQKGDALKYAAQWQAADILQLLDFMLSFLCDLLRLQAQCGEESVVNTDFMQLLLTLKSHFTTTKIVKYVDYLQQVRRYLLEFNLNKQLLLEDIFIRFAY